MSKNEPTRYFTFSQNNSRGVFLGPAIKVIVEAANAAEANHIAENVVGLYFDGCASGIDCNCCGDRWDPQWDKLDGDKRPEIYGLTIDEHMASDRFKWGLRGRKSIPEVALYRRGSTEPELWSHVDPPTSERSK